jgi:primosomal protein N' (replication factor Y)
MSVATPSLTKSTPRALAATTCDVALPVPVRSTFAYTIPRHLASRVRPGCRVVVPFGSRLVTGFVVGLDPVDAPSELKSVRALVDTEPLVDDALLSLTRWIAERTLCSWGEALKAALPGHTAPRRERMLSLGASTARDLFGAAGGSIAERIVAAVGESGELAMRALPKALGLTGAEVAEEVHRLVRARRLKIAERGAGSAPSGPPRVKIVRLTAAGASAVAAAGDVEAVDDDRLRRAPVQARCAELLREAGGELPLRDLAEAVAGSRAAVKRLVEKKLCEVRLEAWEGKSSDVALRVVRPELHAAQAAAVDAIALALQRREPRVFLLHGVTGSGKTEVYLRAMEEAHRQGRRSIILVPEIALTPQTVTRLRGRFGGRAAVLHSQLADAERRRTFHLAREGRFDVVLGPRSAIFTPLPDLGLIVIDEEHEGAYKQDDAPRYHARDVALERARRAGAVVVLGSATPDLETWARAECLEFVRLRLPERVSDLPLPSVRLVDLRGERGIFTATLLDAIAERLRRREQTILFLNRRGFSPFVQCVVRRGHPLRPMRGLADLPPRRGALRCTTAITRRPRSPRARRRARRLALRGSGTQRVEEELRARFPEARLARLDSDSVRKRGAHKEILGQFLEGEIDILLGTQMVAKGLDFPRVTLVGVVNADIGLHLPDYRSAERTFQLLAQVAGRAGRSSLGGEVIVQTRCPDHPCLKAARDHDDEAFRGEELPQRKELRYPPFAKLAGVLVRGESLARVEAAADAIKRRLDEAARGCRSWTTVLGPAPAALAQLRGKHRFRLLVKGEREEDVREAASRALEALPGFPGVEVLVDVAPLDML